MFGFKKAAAREIPFIQDIMRKTWPEAYGNILSEEQLFYMMDLMYSEKALSNQFEEGHLFYFVYQDDEMAGFASLQMIDDDTAKLHKIYILPHYQGSGIGKALLTFVVNKAKSLHAARLLLNVNRKNPARFFYKKMGFVIIDEKDIDIGNGFFMNDFIMSLDLQTF